MFQAKSLDRLKLPFSMNIVERYRLWMVYIHSYIKEILAIAKNKERSEPTCTQKQFYTP